MKTLLVFTTGQSDVQLVRDGKRSELDSRTCGQLHDEIAKRSWTLADAPREKVLERTASLPNGDPVLCTPKLDAVLSWFDGAPPVAVLILETRRTLASDPRFAGDILERRLGDCGVSVIVRHAYLENNERLEDSSIAEDSVLRREIVGGLSDTILKVIQDVKPERIALATTGGLAVVNELVTELVRLHAVSGPKVVSLEVPDGAFAAQDDRAVEEKFHPAAGYRSRWHALSLIEKGNLLGAWGAVSHLETQPDQEWIHVVKWLANFASSLPLPTDCDLAVLSHKRMAVCAALRVELALRAGDIPRAVQGTVAFFEAALWDHLLEHFERIPDNNNGWLKLRDGKVAPIGNLLRDGGGDDKNRPFEKKLQSDGQLWYRFHESGAGRFARDYIKSEPLSEPLRKFQATVEKVKPLRNDVAHNEPTPKLMDKARAQMLSAELWSDQDTFLSQPLVQNVLEKLGVSKPSMLLEDMLSEVRRRIVTVSLGKPAP